MIRGLPVRLAFNGPKAGRIFVVPCLCNPEGPLLGVNESQGINSWPRSGSDFLGRGIPGRNVAWGSHVEWASKCIKAKNVSQSLCATPRGITPRGGLTKRLCLWPQNGPYWSRKAIEAVKGGFRAFRLSGLSTAQMNTQKRKYSAALSI